jgi:DNA-binding NarL/FixJ family response regulator
MIRVALFEDHPVVLRSLESYLNEQTFIEIVFTAKTKTELYDKVSYHHDIDVFVVDLLGIDVRGLEVYDYLCSHYPRSSVISFTSIASPVLVENLLTIGVKGYVNKNQDIEDLLEAIELVYNGAIYLPEDYNFLIKRIIEFPKVSLSGREIEIVNLIALEYTTNDIASRLGISVNTVENHRKTIFQKFDVKNVAGMMREASKLGYLS